MSYEEALRTITLEADSTIGIFTGPPGVPGSTNPNYGKQYRFLKVTAVHKAGLCDTTTNEICVGVLQNKPQAVGAAATVAIAGVSNVMSGGAITAGAPVKVDANGAAVAATPGTDAALYVGVALGTTTGSGQLLPVLLMLA